MNLAALSVGSCLALAALPALGQTPLTPAQLITNVQGFYAGAASFEADFTQTTRNALTATQTTRTGHLFLARNGKVRFDYSNGDVIVSDGTTVWVYDAANRSAVRLSAQNSPIATAFAFFTGGANLAASFAPSLLNANAMQFPAGYVLQLRPLQSNPVLARLVLYVEPAHFQAARVVLLDPQGNRNRFDFLAPAVNTNPPPSTFVWSPPAGTQIVRP